jgi:shikimate dehydrogenase
MYKLGLIGISIQKSSAPSLHTMMGNMNNLPVSYDLNEPGENSIDAFSNTLDRLIGNGYQGCNVTFPFKQTAIGFVDHVNDAVKKVGSTNTLLFKDDQIFAFNTDYTGFIRGYRYRLGEQSAGKVLLIGAGGVGRAIAFALFDVGASEVQIFDVSEQSAKALADAINEAGFKASTVTKESLVEAAKTCDGLVNCTPVGHYTTPGNPLPEDGFGGQTWAFDAVYTPMDTEFLKAAHKHGLSIVSGFDLFLYQGLDAYEIFTSQEVDEGPVREAFKEKFGINSELIDA